MYFSSEFQGKKIICGILWIAMPSAHTCFIIKKEQGISNNYYIYTNPVNAWVKVIRGKNIVMFLIIIARGLQRDIIFSPSDTPAWRCVSKLVGPHRQTRVLLSAVQQGHSRTGMSQREGHQCAHPSTPALLFFTAGRNTSQFSYLGRHSLEIMMYFMIYLQYKVED